MAKDHGIYDPELERHCIAALLKYPKLYFEVCNIVNSNDFYYDGNQKIYDVIKSLIMQDVEPTPVLVANRIGELGITLSNGLGNAFNYLQATNLISFSEKSGYSFFQELVSMRVRRDVFNTAAKLAKFVRDSKDLPIGKLLSSADAIYNEKISLFDLHDGPTALFESAEQNIEEIANNPVKDTGLLTPYPDFNRLWGGLRRKELYAFCARPKNNKSTFLADIIYKTANITNQSIPCLLLDTEMNTLDIQKRLVASISGVPFWYIDTGNWRQVPEFKDKIRNAWKTIATYKFDHMEVGNKSTEEVTSIIRRWAHSKVGRGNIGICAYDYLKLTGSDQTSNSWAEHQIIGDKVNQLKSLAKELEIPMLTAAQLNRSGESQNRKAGAFVDDNTAISLSDRLAWFASFIAIFRKKTLDEIQIDGVENGTHMMRATSTRFTGKDGAVSHDYVERMVDGKKTFASNYVSFKIDNFNVEEVGSLDKVLARGKNKINIQTNQSAEEPEF